MIDYSEFVLASIDRKKMLSKKRLEKVFKMFDKDGSGTISYKELKKMFGGKDSNIEDKVWKALLHQADKDGNEEVILLIE